MRTVLMSFLVLFAVATVQAEPAKIQNSDQPAHGVQRV